MNIKITYNWLLEYLDTDATPEELGKYLSLSGPSIERIDKVDNDYVFDIEITSNRIDMASVFGIAQEAQAILPQFGKKAQLKFNPLTKYTFHNLNVELAPHKNLDVEIKDHDLCSRFTALIFSDVHIAESPELIKNRLAMVDIKSINNVIDISNYLMISLGQPVHMFDYDKINGHKMIMRESIKGEKVTTLDEKEIILPGGDIVIEDGSGTLIDLCGIMGGLNSSITNDTTSIVFFVQTYNKRKIRRTSMTTAQRTIAATYFEKGLDPERVEPTLVYGVDLIRELTNGLADSELIDIYQKNTKEHHVLVTKEEIDRLMGVDIKREKIIDILHRLGFTVKVHENNTFHVTIPSYRQDDIKIKQDIIEEIARVYGYYNLPNTISPMVYIAQPKEIERFYTVQQKIKYFLRDMGLHEVMNYSMVSEELLTTLKFNLTDHLRMANTISKEIEYMRLSLLPSLLKNMKENMGKRDDLKFFEVAKVYPPVKGKLPDEQYKLGIAVNSDFADLKGIIEALFRVLHIPPALYSKGTYDGFAPHMQATISDTKTREVIGTIGKINSSSKESLGLKEDVYLAQLDCSYLVNAYKIVDTYRATNTFAQIKLDATILQKPNYSYAQLSYDAYELSSLLRNIEYVGSYKDNMTLRFYFSSTERNITESEAKSELEMILQKLADHER